MSHENPMVITISIEIVVNHEYCLWPSHGFLKTCENDNMMSFNYFNGVNKNKTWTIKIILNVLYFWPRYGSDLTLSLPRVTL